MSGKPAAQKPVRTDSAAAMAARRKGIQEMAMQRGMSVERYVAKFVSAAARKELGYA